MKFPLSWLKEYLPTRLTPEQIAENLTLLGLEATFTDDLVFELSLTPNLGRCANIRGIARELSAVTQERLQTPTIALHESQRKAKEQATLRVEAADACPLYACRIISGLTVRPSPEWLKKRLEDCGMRSINNLVDITNLIMLELGQPLHAFDLEKLSGHTVIVRFAKHNEKILGLDGKEYFPTEETLLICDAKEPIAIAGIIGGAHTEVSEATHTILLESAYFEPKQVRRAGKRMGICTEASRRFERGVDPNSVVEALNRASALIAEIGGGSILQGIILEKSQDFPEKHIPCRLSRINRLLGTQLATGEVETLMKRMDLKVESVHSDTITVIVPTYRNDIKEEIDLIEEVARLYGYNNIPQPRQTRYSAGALPNSPSYLFEKEVRNLLISEGLQEFITCNLISPSQSELISTQAFPSRSLIRLLNPQSVDQSILRPSLLPGLLTLVRYNADHGIHTVAGFEVGKIHFKMKDAYLEPPVVSIILSGKRRPDHWDGRVNPFDFFDLKGIIENLLKALKITDATFSRSKIADFHPGREASLAIKGHEIGVMGEIHPRVLKQIDIKHPVFFAEINLEDLRRYLPEHIKMIPLPIFPDSTFDWTIPLHETIPSQKLIDEIINLHSKLLESVSIIDVYHDEKLGSEWKKVTLRLIYRDREKTLLTQEVENEHERITTHVLHNLKPSI